MPMVTPDQNILDVEVDFTSGASGASTTFPQQCSALRKGGHVLIRGRPCKIVDMSTSKTGKHGHAKVALVGLDIFTGKKLEDMCPSTHNKDVPNVTRKEYEVVNFSRDGYFSMMCDDGTLRSDLALTNLCNPSEKEAVTDMLKEVEEGYDRVVQAMVLGAMGEEVVKDLKIVKA